MNIHKRHYVRHYLYWVAGEIASASQSIAHATRNTDESTGRQCQSVCHRRYASN